jgi:hypothetical protein
MSQTTKEGELRLGFLTSIEVPDHGYMGGLLVTNRQGRPLEFQCTTPVKPNRTQEILYGPTLVPFLLSDLIGRTLVEKVGVKPDLILTERPEILELRRHVTVPVACVAEPTQDAPKTEAALALGRQFLRFHAAHESDRESIEKKTSLVPREADLCEPFERVREALQEAMQLKGE